MQYKRLGKTEFMASRLGFGGASISGEGKGYGFGPISEDKSIELIQYACEQGINIFDTAPIYGYGESEIRIGKGIREFRDKVMIISKSGVGWHSNGRVDMNNDPKITRKMLEDSLRRLDSDFIDLYMVHWPDAKWDIRYPLDILAKAQAQGKIKYIGLCNTNEDDLVKAQDVCEISVVQCEHNLFEQNPLNQLKDIIVEMDLGFMSWGTLDKGILSGTVYKDRTFAKEDARSWAPWWNKKVVAKKVKRVEQLKELIPNVSLLELALNFNLQNPLISTSLCGAKSIAQLSSLVQAMKSNVTANDIMHAQEILSD